MLRRCKLQDSGLLSVFIFFRYSITEGNQQGAFDIDRNTAKITTRKRLDRETMASYRLQVLAQNINNKCHKGRTVVIVNVKDENDNAPEFSKAQYDATIEEGLPIGSLVAKVTATDKDAGINAQLSYRFTSANADKRFAINNRGEVTTLAVLDFEEKSSYTLGIKVTDGGTPPLSDTTVLHVVVQNRNEPPVFSTACALNNTCTMRIQENQPASTQFGIRLSASDPDKYPSCNPLNYKIKTEQSQVDVFKISNIGGISTLQKLDREAKNQYTVLVTVEDCNKPPLKALTRVKIEVEDRNDNSPSFALQQYSTSLYEDVSINSVVIQVTATGKVLLHSYLTVMGRLSHSLVFAYIRGRRLLKLIEISTITYSIT